MSGGGGGRAIWHHRPHRSGTSLPSPSPDREILSPLEPQHSPRVREWLLSRAATQRPQDMLHLGGTRGRRPLGPWHEPRGAVPWVGVTATRRPSPSYLVTEMSASPPGITAGPPALSRCPLHPVAASPRVGDVRVPSASADENEEGFCSALARGEDGRGERPRLPPGSAASAPGLRLCLTPSHALPLALRGGRRPASIASGLTAPPPRPRLPPNNPAGPAPLCRWDVVLADGTAPRMGSRGEPPTYRRAVGWQRAASPHVKPQSA